MQKISAGQAAVLSSAAQRPFSTLVVLALWKLTKGVFKGLWRAKITLAWVLGAWFIANAVNANLGLFLGLVGLGLLVSGFWQRKLWPWAPVMGDALRIRANLGQKRAAQEANAWLRHVGLVSVEDPQWYAVTMEHLEDRVRLTVHRPMPGIPYARWVQIAQDYSEVFDSVRVLSEDLGGGACQIDWLQVDALDEPFVIDSPAALDPEKMQVDCARDVNGQPFALKFAGSAALVVAGMPGSGKTAGVSSFLLPMALSDEVELSVIDGKGGTDWTSYEPVSRQFISLAESEDFEAARDLLGQMKTEMVQRLQSQQVMLGQSNFWNASAKERKAAGLPFKLLVIDEAQEVFTPSDASKESKALAQEMTALITTIVKRGRSAGCFIILITQKTTTDAIPSSIRDNAGLKIAFRLETSEGERAVLGSVPDDPSAPRATEIPRSRPGGAVVVTDKGTREMVRFAYMAEQEQAALLGGE